MRTQRIGIAWAMALLAIGAPAMAGPVVEVEEIIAHCEPPDNGSSPFWAYGSPMLVRVGDQVFASVMETGKDVPPLCNTRWRLFQRDDQGWKDALHPEDFRQREPCPLITTGPDQLFLSVNDSKTPPGTKYGPCDPHLLSIKVRNPAAEPTKIDLGWAEGLNFTDHSYRAIAADGPAGEALPMNIDAKTSALHWSFRDKEGKFVRQGAAEFPIRSCYAQVALKDRVAHMLAIGDIVEPIQEWREYKHEKTGRAWDYVFRRLFYTRNPDVAGDEFAEPIEVDTVEETAGHITNLDLWLDKAGNAHLLYLKSSHTPIIRDRFFPGEPIVKTLEYAIVKDDQVTHHEALLTGGENQPETPQYGRFQATADGALHVVYSAIVRGEDGSNHLENRVQRLSPDREAKPTKLDLEKPFSMFFNATERGGSAPSDTLDLLGPGAGTEIRYARIRLR